MITIESNFKIHDYHNLSEGFFSDLISTKIQEVPYRIVVEAINNFAEAFSYNLDTSIVGSHNIQIYTDKIPVLHFYILKDNDYRSIFQYPVSREFSITEIAHKTGFSEELIMKEIFDCADNALTKAGSFLEYKLYYANYSRTSLNLMLCFKKGYGFRDIITNKGVSKYEMSSDEFNTLFKSLSNKIIAKIQEHPLGRLLTLKPDLNQIYKYDANYGNGFIAAISKPYYSYQFSKMYSNELTHWDFYCNLLFYVESELLYNTQLSLFIANLGDNRDERILFVNSKYNVVCK